MATKRMIFRLLLCLLMFVFFTTMISFFDFDEMAQTTIKELRKYPGKLRRFRIRSDDLLPVEFEEEDRPEENHRESRDYFAQLEKYRRLRRAKYDREMARRQQQRNDEERKREEREEERMLRKEMEIEKREGRKVNLLDIGEGLDKDSVDSIQFLPPDHDAEHGSPDVKKDKADKIPADKIPADKIPDEKKSSRKNAADVAPDLYDKKVIQYNSPGRCPTPGNSMSGLILIMAEEDEFAERQAIRDSWAKDESIIRGRMIHLFHIRRDVEQSVKEAPHLALAVKKEWKEHKDIFYSTRRLSEETHFPFALKWVQEFCPDISFVVRADTLSFVNVISLDKFMHNIWSITQTFFLGHFGSTGNPDRMPQITNYVVSGPIVNRYLSEIKAEKPARGAKKDVTEESMIRRIKKHKFDIAQLHVQGFLIKGNLDFKEMSCSAFESIYCIWNVDTSFMKGLGLKNQGCI